CARWGIPYWYFDVW
nr:immunoglobulin heavy chain junction region [Mus musculus]MBK4187064.1 immunoglobulin heavy chain junction region [Mus musculus]